MKVLMLSLLRLGDILMHRTLVQNLKRQHPNAQIHFLINEQFRSVTSLLPEVDQWHFLDRQKIQKILVEGGESPLLAFEIMQKMIDELNQQEFDHVYNLTHTKLSVRLMDLLVASEKHGVALSQGVKVEDRNSWQEYLNENFPEAKGSRFHYLEVLHRALEIPMSLPEVAHQRRNPLILLQLLTADEKKNWGLTRFASLKKSLAQIFPQARILGLCSPAESKKVSEVFAWNEFLTPSLDEAAELLKEASLLITGDTSIQHLAGQNGCPVLSLFLGSADPVKTAPWQMGAWVIQGQAACPPCRHSSPCHQAQHLCAESIRVEQVVQLVQALLQRDEVKLKTVSGSRTRADQGHFSLHLSPTEILQNLERRVWSLFLDARPSSIQNSILDFEFATRAELEALIKHHEKFVLSVEMAKRGQKTLTEVEEEFPQWQDSLIRWKRRSSDFHEVDRLIEIRREFLNSWIQKVEIDNVRREQSTDDQCLAEA